MSMLLNLTYHPYKDLIPLIWKQFQCFVYKAGCSYIDSPKYLKLCFYYLTLIYYIYMTEIRKTNKSYQIVFYKEPDQVSSVPL